MSINTNYLNDDYKREEENKRIRELPTFQDPLGDVPFSEAVTQSKQDEKLKKIQDEKLKKIFTNFQDKQTQEQQLIKESEEKVKGEWEEKIIQRLKLDTIEANTPENKKAAIDRILAFIWANSSRNSSRNSSELCLAGLGLTSLPHSLFCSLTHLTQLDLSDNELTELPNPLPENLKRLNLSRNQLTQLTQSPCFLPQSLEELLISHNSITALPDSLPQKLKILSMHNNQITLLPPSISQSSLRRFDCSYNQLTKLPDSLPNCLEYLDFSNNKITELPPLPTSLKTLVGRHNELKELPVLHEGLEYLDVGNNQLMTLPPIPNSVKVLVCRMNYIPPNDRVWYRFSLEEQKQSWAFKLFKAKASDPSLKNLDDVLFPDDPELQSNVYQWLIDLIPATEFQKFASNFASKVLDILKCAQNNKEYCDVLKGQLTEAFGACVDRSTLPINYLGVQKRIVESNSKSIENLLEILKGSFALSVLDKYAKEFCQSDVIIDEIEVYLGLQVALKERDQKVDLKDRLNLPVEVNEMKYFRCSYLQKEHINEAASKVKLALADRQQVIKFLISDKTWTDRLKKDFHSELENELQTIYDELESLDAKKELINSNMLQEKSKALLKKKEQIEQEWIIRKTEHLLNTTKAQ